MTNESVCEFTLIWPLQLSVYNVWRTHQSDHASDQYVPGIHGSGLLPALSPTWSLHGIPSLTSLCTKHPATCQWTPWSETSTWNICSLFSSLFIKKIQIFIAVILFSKTCINNRSREVLESSVGYHALRMSWKKMKKVKQQKTVANPNKKAIGSVGLALDLYCCRSTSTDLIPWLFVETLIHWGCNHRPTE